MAFEYIITGIFVIIETFLTLGGSQQGPGAHIRHNEQRQHAEDGDGGT